MAESKEEILRKLFIGGLSRDTTEETFRQYFEGYGELVDCVIIRDNTKTSRGFGFVTFANEHDLQEVLKVKINDGHMIDGKSVDVKRAIPRDAEPDQREKNNKIFLGGLSRDTTEETIQKYFEDTFKCPVESVDLIYEKKDQVAPGMQPQKRGFGFVTINDFDVVDHICVIKYHPIDNKDVEVKKAAPKDQTSRRGGRANFGRSGGGREGGGGRFNNSYNGGYNQGGYGNNGGGYNQYNSYGNGGGSGGYNQYGGQGGDYNNQGYGGYNEGGYSSYGSGQNSYGSGQNSYGGGGQNNYSGGQSNYGGGYQNSNYSGAEKSTGRGGKFSGSGGARGGYRPY